jgi:hypothetical protein
MIKLHDTTVTLMTKMYDPEEFQKVMEHIVLFLLTEPPEGHAFMVLEFDDTHIAEPEIDGPTENYIWN